LPRSRPSSLGIDRDICSRNTVFTYLPCPLGGRPRRSRTCLFDALPDSPCARARQALSEAPRGGQGQRCGVCPSGAPASRGRRTDRGRSTTRCRPSQTVAGAQGPSDSWAEVARHRHSRSLIPAIKYSTPPIRPVRTWRRSQRRVREFNSACPFLGNRAAFPSSCDEPRAPTLSASHPGLLFAQGRRRERRL